MANAVLTITTVFGYTTPIGNRAMSVKRVTWNAAQYPAGGFIIGVNTFGLRGLDWVNTSDFTFAGNYLANTQIAAIGAKQMSLRLMVAATNVEVATGAVLIADGVSVCAVGG